jgi:hypothetical protein
MFDRSRKNTDKVEYKDNLESPQARQKLDRLDALLDICSTIHQYPQAVEYEGHNLDGREIKFYGVGATILVAQDEASRHSDEIMQSISFFDESEVLQDLFHIFDLGILLEDFYSDTTTPSQKAFERALRVIAIFDTLTRWTTIHGRDVAGPLKHPSRRGQDLYVVPIPYQTGLDISG